MPRSRLDDKVDHGRLGSFDTARGAGAGCDRRASLVMNENRHVNKLGTLSGVYIPVFLNIMSILMFLRFGLILGQVGFLGIFALLIVAYSIDLLTTLSLSAIASNGEVKGGGAYYLISRSLGPEFGGSIGILFFLAQVLNASMNVVGLIDCIRLNLGPAFPQGYWTSYGLQTAALMLCTGLCFLGSATFSKASNALLVVLSLAIISIPVSSVFKAPFRDETLGIDFTGPSFNTLADNFLPHVTSPSYKGLDTFRDLFGILFPATSGIFAGASMSGDLKDPSRSIPNGTLWAMLTTFIAYFVVILSLAASTTHESFLANPNAISLVNLSKPVILAGECAVTFFSALMGLIGSAKLFQAFARDRLLPGLCVFGRGTKHGDEPFFALLLTYVIAQVALLADLNQIATFISMGYQMTFFVMNLACFLLKVGSAPNFRPSFKFFTWQSALLAGLLSATAMFFIDETYAAIAISVLVLLFLLIHYLSPPKRWGDVSQNLIYHQVRKYLLRLRPEHIKFWRPHIILLINNPRRQTRLIQFCNSLKKGSLYILGHVIVTDDFDSGVHEARLQQHAWTHYISEFSRIKAFVQLTMSPTITWGIRNLILSAGLGGMRPNIAVLGFYNMDELRKSNLKVRVPDVPAPPSVQMRRPPKSTGKSTRRRGDTSARLLEGFLPTDVIRNEEMMSPTQYVTILEDLAHKHKLNVAVGYGFEKLETPKAYRLNRKKYIDLWPIQVSAQVSADGKNLLTTNFDTYTLILQLGHILHSVRAWNSAYSLRVMFFVEYANEVNEEFGRVRALLEKLRIEADIQVFCLASGELNTYELIIHGESHDIDWEIVVNDTLKAEEWWDELQTFRGQQENMTSVQEAAHLAHIFDSTSGRPGIYNPHEEPYERRRASMIEISDIPRRPPVSVLAKMGVNVGIHTHHLHDEVFDDSVTDDESEIDEVSSTGSDEEIAYTSLEGLMNNGDAVDPLTQPLLSSRGRLRSRNDREGSDASIWGHYGQSRRLSMGDMLTSSYGTMAAYAGASSQRRVEPRSTPRVPMTEAGRMNNKELEAFPSLAPLNTARASRSRPISPSREDTLRPLRDGTTTPARPNLSRQSSAVRFSSRPMPETRVTTEGEASKISFAPSPSEPSSETPKADRPNFSRQSSWGKFSSRPTPETRTGDDDEEGRTISFAEEPAMFGPRSAGHSRHHSRQSSAAVSFAQSELRSPLPEMAEGHEEPSPGHVEEGQGQEQAQEQVWEQAQEQGQEQEQEQEHATPFSASGVELSFNELPSRAQHLILNELMRQHSKDTAVILTTLPIPSEGTSLDESSTIRYLSDVEVLCNEMPPTLMVLSNNMTVTVSL